MSDEVTITITEDKSGVFFATSENDPPLFCAATSLSGIFESIERVLEAGKRADQMVSLDKIWRGWCHDPQCPHNPFFGIKPGAKLCIKIPKDKART